MNITDVCIRKPVLAWMIMTATVVFGGVAASRIGISQFPDVDQPNVSIAIRWEGAAPEVIETEVVDILEEALSQVEGVREIKSTSRQGAASINVELRLERNVDLALQDVTTRVAQAQRRLPADIEPPVVTKSNPEDQPILWLGLSGPLPQQELSDYARYRIKERLQIIPGVGEIIMGGWLERNVRIWLDAERLDERGLTVAEVIAALRREHIELPAGQLEAGGREVNVRVLGEAIDLEGMRSLVVANLQGGPVRLGDVGLVEDGFEDMRRKARINGDPATGLGIRKQRGSNAVEVATAVRQAVTEMQPTLPEGMTLGINYDSTRFIEESVHEIEFELLLAVLLTAVVCWLFLGSFSSTLNVILAIPMSLLGTIAVIYFAGFTLNTFTLLGLGLAVGIVVDDAIMVLENIVRHGEMGKDPVRAASEGTREIAFAALAATIAVVAIFIPVVFMEGVIGKNFLQFGVVLCVAVLFSYVEAVTLAPARCAQMLGRSQRQSGFGHWVDRRFAGLARLYGRVLGGALRRPLLVLLLAAVGVVVSFWVLTTLPRTFVPPQDQGLVRVILKTAVGSNLAESDHIISQAERLVNARPEVDRAFVIVGSFDNTQSNQGFMFLTLVPPDQRTLTQQQLIGQLYGQLNAIPGLRAFPSDPSVQVPGVPGRGRQIEFSLQGPDWETLVQENARVVERLRDSGLVVGVDTDYQLGMPELRVVPDRDLAADLGIGVQDVATSINALIGGVQVGKYSSEGRRMDMRVRLLADQRSRPEDLARLRVRSAAGELIPLSAVVSSVERPVLQEITRRDRERSITIQADPAPGRSLDDALSLVRALGDELPDGYRVKLSGTSAMFGEAFWSLMFAFILGLGVAYMVLAGQFNSLLHPLTVLSILPLTVAGAAFALLLAGQTLNMFSMIGLLLLAGIAKKNSIILVDYTNQLRDQGRSTLEALLEAGPVRLRPILMTSAATVMSALPLALALGPGGEIRQPMALAVIGGIIVSTVLSLVVVPAFYLVADRLLVAARRRMPKAAEAPLPETPRSA